MRALWSIGRVRYLGEAASAKDIFLGGPKALEVFRPPDFGVEAKTEDLVYLDATKPTGREEMLISLRARVGEMPNHIAAGDVACRGADDVPRRQLATAHRRRRHT
jgi:hypothetical protein